MFAFYKALIDKGVINPDGASWGWEEEDTNFALGQYAMVIDGAWMDSREAQNPEAMKDVTICAPPYKEKPATFFEINPFYVYKAGKHPKETWDFVTFMNGKEFQEAVHPNNSPRSDVATDSKWGKDFTALAPTGVVFPPVPLGAITRDMIESLGRTLLKNEEPEAVAKWLSAAINKDLRQAGELSSELSALSVLEVLRRMAVSAACRTPARAEPIEGSSAAIGGAAQPSCGRLAALCVAPAAVFFLLLIAYPLARVIWTRLPLRQSHQPDRSAASPASTISPPCVDDERFWPSLWRTWRMDVRLGRWRVRARPRLGGRARPADPGAQRLPRRSSSSPGSSRSSSPD